MTRTMTKTHTKTNTKTKTKTNTKCLKDPSNAIFLKSKGFKDIKYDNTNCVTQLLTSRPKKCIIEMPAWLN